MSQAPAPGSAEGTAVEQDPPTQTEWVRATDGTKVDSNHLLEGYMTINIEGSEASVVVKATDGEAFIKSETFENLVREKRLNDGDIFKIGGQTYEIHQAMSGHYHVFNINDYKCDTKLCLMPLDLAVHSFR